MAAAVDPGVTALERIWDLKRSLGALVRKCDAGVEVSEAEFRAAADRMRHHLNALEIQLAETPPERIELADLSKGVGRALGELLDSGALKPARALLPEGVQRARTHGRLTVIDGGRPFDTPFTGD